MESERAKRIRSFVIGGIVGSAAGLVAAHHLLLGHGLAVRALRARTTKPVMLINSFSPAWPASGSEADGFAAGFYDLLQNRLFTEPVLLGRYPDEVTALIADGVVRDGDLDVITAGKTGLFLSESLLKPPKPAARGR